MNGRSLDLDLAISVMIMVVHDFPPLSVEA